MAKTPRATDGTAPKRRAAKAKVETEASTKVAKVIAKPVKQQDEVAAAPNLEEKVRVRAYELYLQRKGQGGSPEQDWLQAVSEVYGQAGA
jgi:hypothetical protein